MRGNKRRVGLYTDMLLCPLSRGDLEPCNTITARSPSIGTEARQNIPERPSSGAADADPLLNDVCGAGAAGRRGCVDAIGGAGWELYETDARNGFPEDMLKTKSNALFYVCTWEELKRGVEHLLCPNAGADVVGVATTDLCWHGCSPASTPPSHMNPDLANSQDASNTR
jgi:hypothetical protein